MWGRAVMSWDVLKGSPASVQVGLVFVWIIGATTIVISSLLRGRNAALWHGILGLAGMMLLMFLLVSGLDPLDMPAFGLTGYKAFWPCSLVFLLGMIITTNIRLRLGGTPLAVRITQGVFAGGALILSAVMFIWFLHDYSQLPGFAKSRMVGDFVFAILMELGAIAGMVLALIHAATVRITRDTLSRTALGLVYGAIVCAIVYWFIRPAMLTDEPGMVFAVLNFFLLIVSVVFLFCSGLVGFVCGLASKTAGLPASTRPARTPAAQPASSASVRERLEELASLRDQGLITEEDYAVKRAGILNEL